MMRFVLTPVFGALVKFGTAPNLSLWVRSVPPAEFLVLAMMAAFPWYAALASLGSARSGLPRRF